MQMSTGCHLGTPKRISPLWWLRNEFVLTQIIFVLSHPNSRFEPTQPPPTQKENTWHFVSPVFGNCQKLSHKTNKPNKEKHIQQPSLKQKSTQPTKRPLTKKRENGRPQKRRRICRRWRPADRRCLGRSKRWRIPWRTPPPKDRSHWVFVQPSGWNSEDADIRKTGGNFSKKNPWKVTNYCQSKHFEKDIGLEDLVFLLGMSVFLGAKLVVGSENYIISWFDGWFWFKLMYTGKMKSAITAAARGLRGWLKLIYVGWWKEQKSYFYCRSISLPLTQTPWYCKSSPIPHHNKTTTGLFEVPKETIQYTWFYLHHYISNGCCPMILPSIRLMIEVDPTTKNDIGLKWSLWTGWNSLSITRFAKVLQLSRCARCIKSPISPES